MREAIAALAKSDQALFVDVAKGIERYGFACPRVRFRQLEGKLWEIKFSTASGGFRIAYVVVVRERMVWLHVFRKEGRRTPRRDLELAQQRMKEVLGA